MRLSLAAAVCTFKAKFLSGNAENEIEALPVSEGLFGEYVGEAAKYNLETESGKIKLATIQLHPNYTAAYQLLITLIDFAKWKTYNRCNVKEI